jgi:hypothetical protein
MSYSQSWLEDPKAIKALFIEVVISKYSGGWASETLYLSSTGYLTEDSLVSFNPVLGNRIKFSESISDSDSSLSYGDVEILNPNGELDDWLDNTKYLWVNKSINIYLGDPFWVSTDLADFKTKFKLIFSGIIADIDSKKRSLLNIRFIDKLQKLNSPITEDKLGTYGTWADGQTNQDTIKPLVFGEVHNIEPLYVDPAQLEYMFCRDNSERIIEVRDNGVPLYTDKDGPGDLLSGITYTAPSGKFKLAYTPAGTITMSVQGVQKSINLTTGATDSTYSNNIAQIIALLVKEYGNSYQRFTASDLDLPNLLAFSTANTQPTGVQVTGSESVFSICSELAASVGAQLVMSKEGKLQLLKYGVPFVNSDITEITDNDIIQGSFNLSQRVPVRATCTIGYCKNWTVQSDLLTAIPEDHKTDYATEYLTKTATDGTGVKALYGLNIDPEQKNTLLVKGTDATAEADRIMTYYRQQHNVYSLTGTSKLLGLKLGQQVSLKYPRFGLTNGLTGQVISLAPSWLDSTIDVEVLV